MTPASRKPRDLRLDFFRGMTMFVIFVAHADINPLLLWIPAQFGFSSGAEAFVFCSGVASSFAFGSVFVKRGFGLGSIRIGLRIWQIYWAHLAVALSIIAFMIKVQPLFPSLHLDLLAEIAGDPQRAIVGLVSLSWLPDYLDILPMYLALLIMVPVMMAMRVVHRLGPILLSVVMYALVWTYGINLPGNPWTNASWYFNPFAWQLIFFTGFFLGMGWIPAPALRQRRLTLICLVVVGFSVPITFWGIHRAVPALDAFHHYLLPANEKSDLHILRYLHFLAVAYLALSVIEPYRKKLAQGVSAAIVTVGQQSLAVFLVSLFGARAASVVFQAYGTGVVVTALVNVAGVVLILVVATLVQWIKSAPWRNENQTSQVTTMATNLPRGEATPACFNHAASKRFFSRGRLAPFVNALNRQTSSRA